MKHCYIITFVICSQRITVFRCAKGDENVDLNKEPIQKPWYSCQLKADLCWLIHFSYLLMFASCEEILDVLSIQLDAYNLITFGNLRIEWIKSVRYKILNKTAPIWRRLSWSANWHFSIFVVFLLHLISSRWRSL